MAGKVGKALLSVTTNEYGDLLEICYNAMTPLFVNGGPGIGKSAIPRQRFSRIAREQHLQYVEWADLMTDEKKACIARPGDYFVLMDARTSQMDTTSIQGVPNMLNTEMLENIPYSWVVYMTQKEANGAIFFDEINLAAPIVQAITYSAIHDRVISDRRMGNNVYIFAAGNRQQDRAHTFDMPLPLRDRFAEVEVTHHVEQWIDWARIAKINPHLIAFIDWKPQRLYKIDIDVNDKPSTPRGLERASKLIGDRKINSDKVHQLVSISAGAAFATEFQAYTECYSKLNWPVLLKNPKSVRDLTLGAQYAVSAGCSEQFLRDKKNHKQTEQLLFLAEAMRQDFTINTFRMMRDADKSAFTASLQKLNKGKDFASKYGKFIMDISQ